MDESATLTIAMSRIVMNCTARISASANHFLLSDPTIGKCPPVSSVRLGDERSLQESTCVLQVQSSILQVKPLHSARGQEVRPVLPDRTRPRPRGGALVAAHRP